MCAFTFTGLHTAREDGAALPSRRPRYAWTKCVDYSCKSSVLGRPPRRAYGRPRGDRFMIMPQFFPLFTSSVRGGSVCRSQPPILRREQRQSFPSYPHSSRNTIAFTIPIAAILLHFHDSAYHLSSPSPSPPFPYVMPPFSLLTSHHFLYPLTLYPLPPAPLCLLLPTPVIPLPSLPTPHSSSSS